LTSSIRHPARKSAESAAAAKERARRARKQARFAGISPLRAGIFMLPPLTFGGFLKMKIWNFGTGTESQKRAFFRLSATAKQPQT
jgi:hypothetical protein